MQYILTHDEYTALRDAPDIVREAEMEKLQILCTLVATHMPVARPWAGKDAEPKPWGCIRNEPTKSNPGYCDDCPVADMCPKKGKRWSK
jgi:hypothetical protein